MARKLFCDKCGKDTYNSLSRSHEYGQLSLHIISETIDDEEVKLKKKYLLDLCPRHALELVGLLDKFLTEVPVKEVLEATPVEEPAPEAS